MNNTFIEKMAVLYQAVPSSLFTSIRLAQAILESSWGQSDLAREANNFAGIKASKDWTGSTHIKYSNEEYNGVVTSERSAFRKYASVEEFVKDHSNFITSTEWRKNHYSSVINAKGYKAQSQALTGLYATDSGYGSKLIELIEKYNLTQYDSKESESVTRHLVICGHGQGPKGYDPGATGPSGTEADWVRKLASVMKKYSGTDIEYVTETNTFEYRDDNRYNINRYSGYASITELHLNAFNEQAKGCEVLIWHEFNADDLDNKLLSILAKYFVNRGIKKRNDLYNMRVSAQLGYNYRLVEVCFVDNVQDMQILSANLDTIARQFVEAITGKSVQVPQPQSTPQQQTPKAERGGTRTADTPPQAFKELKEGQVVEVRQQATHYENGAEISPRVNGNKYTITGVRQVEKSMSKRAYRLAVNNVAIGWVLEQDIVEAWQEDKPQKESQEITLNGKKYKIEEQ